ncbi:type-F conjugative transfer system protein TrbI [Aeromonas salmonicida]|uniref:type-F conjugative transfer system protein TrbI n=2 Tax=Aeromonas salmonicida TaxID=645 RepID=UPI0023EFA398|nr:type-F conjugative transfer system protein TrbI [Aeromonas salmonicida]MDF8326975.1 type-F conjugative transfer system protein TrbI [Aeromonas salmonicida]
MAPLIPPPPTDNAPATRAPRRTALGWMLALAVLTTLNLAATGWLALHRTPTPVAFDMKGTIDQFMEQSASQSLTEAQSKQLVARFTQALDASLSAWQQEHRALILVTPSVVRGADDITRTIQHDIAIRMRAQLAQPATTWHEEAQ